MQNTQIIRRFKLKDIFSLTNLLGQEWNLGKRQSQTPGNICAWLYALCIIADATRLFTYEKDAWAIGFIGYSAYKTPKSLKQHFCNFLFQLLFFHPQIKYRQKLREYYDNYEYIPEDMKTSGTCNLSILILDSAYRGLQIGRRLFEFMIANACTHGQRKLLIETDESCNVTFYEKSGCKKLQEVGIYDEQGTGRLNEKAFIFVKDL